MLLPLVTVERQSVVKLGTLTSMLQFPVVFQHPLRSESRSQSEAPCALQYPLQPQTLGRSTFSCPFLTRLIQSNALATAFFSRRRDKVTGRFLEANFLNLAISASSSSVEGQAIPNSPPITSNVLSSIISELTAGLLFVPESQTLPFLF